MSCIYLHDDGCMAGTTLGKVWLHTFQENRTWTLAGFSDEGVRGLYMDEECSVASLGESYRSWQRSLPSAAEREVHVTMPSVCFRTLDKRNTQSVKHVLQRGPKVCVLFQVSAAELHVKRKEHHQRAFKIFDVGSTAEVAPCDYDGERLLVIDRTQSGNRPVFRLVHLERNETIVVDLPKAPMATIFKIWGLTSLVYSISNTLHVYDYATSTLRMSLTNLHRTEVIAIDASNEDIIASLSLDGYVALWSGVTGQCRHSFYVPEANFFLGYPYYIGLRGQRVLVSADEGVFLVEFDVDLSSKDSPPGTSALDQA